MPKIDTLNKFMVGANALGLALLNPPRLGQVLSPDEALVLAAYLVSMAEHQSAHTFEEVLAAVQGA